MRSRAALIIAPSRIQERVYLRGPGCNAGPERVTRICAVAVKAARTASAIQPLPAHWLVGSRTVQSKAASPIARSAPGGAQFADLCVVKDAGADEEAESFGAVE